MKSGKAAGVCGIPAELLKADGDTVQRELQFKNWNSCVVRVITGNTAATVE